MEKSFKELFENIGESTTDPFIYVPSNPTSDTPVIFYVPGLAQDSNGNPTYGGYNNEGSTGELRRYISNHPDCIVVLGTHSTKQNEQIPVALEYIENNILGGKPINNFTVDAFSYGTMKSISSAANALEITNNNGEKIIGKNMTIMIGGTGEFIEKKITEEQINALKENNTNVMFFCQQNGTNGPTEYNPKMLAENEPLVKQLKEAGINTYIVGVNWKNAQDEEIAKGFGQHPLTNRLIQHYWFPIKNNDSDAIDIRDNKYFQIYDIVIDENGNLILNDAMEDTYLLLTNGNAILSSYIMSNYAKTLQLIEEINEGTTNLNLEDYIPQIQSNTENEELVHGTNDAIINYEITNSNLVYKLTNEMYSIMNVIEALNAFDEALATQTEKENIKNSIDSISNLNFTISYGNFKPDNTSYIDYINIDTFGGSDISIEDVNTIKNVFNEMITNDNEYLSKMTNQIYSLKEHSENEGEYWEKISSSLNTYLETIDTKINFNKDVLNNIETILNNILEILYKFGKNPVTQKELDELKKTKKIIETYIEEAYKDLYIYNEIVQDDGTIITKRVINEASQKELRTYEPKLLEIIEEIEEYEETLVLIKEQEKALNEEFYNIQKYNSFVNQMLPEKYPCICLNSTGMNYIDNYRNENMIHSEEYSSDIDRETIEIVQISEE